MTDSSLLVRICRKIVSPLYQVVLLMITASIVLFLGERSLRRFQALEKYTAIETITPEMLKQWKGEPVRVEVGIYISNWHRFDLVENDFIFDGVVWFQFDPSLISLDTIDKFAFEKGELLTKSEPDTKLIDGKLLAEYKIRLRFTTFLSQRFFPLDDHRIYIGLINTSVSPSEMVFYSFKSNFVTSDKIDIPAWNRVDTEVKTGYEEEFYDKFDTRKVIRFPKAVFMMDISRSGIRLILLIFLPLFLIFFISLFWFNYEPDKTSPIMYLSTGAVTSLIAYRFVIQNMSPKEGYFLLSDHIFTIFLAFAFFSFVFSLIWVREGSMTPGMIILRGIVFVCFHILVIISWYILLFQWIKGQ